MLETTRELRYANFHPESCETSRLNGEAVIAPRKNWDDRGDSRKCETGGWFSRPVPPISPETSNTRRAFDVSSQVRFFLFSFLFTHAKSNFFLFAQQIGRTRVHIYACVYHSQGIIVRYRIIEERELRCYTPASGKRNKPSQSLPPRRGARDLCVDLSALYIHFEQSIIFPRSHLVHLSVSFD